MNNQQLQGFYEFERFRLDLKKKRLTHGETIVSLTPKEFDVLFFLIENAGKVVEKDELLDAVWKDTFVEEGTLTRNISWLRKKLAKYGGDLQIIETLPKRGYRFLPEIHKADENLIIVEEEIVQQIQVEEIIEISPSDEKVFAIDEKISPTPKLLPSGVKRSTFSMLWLIPVSLIFVSFVIYRAYFATVPPQMILASKIAPFSGLPGREITPAFSPDGKQLVYAWDGGIDGGNFDIYVKIVGAGEPVRLTATETDELNPVFSPDGKSIAFVRNFPDHNEIILISALGGAERKLYEKASYASVSFSHDGKYLAVADLDLSQKEAGIFLINLQTLEKKRITSPENPIVDHTPRFSPDGKNLAFIRHFSSFRREIFTVALEGGEPRQITDDNVRIYGLAWNNDSRNLFFTSFRTTSQLNLWEVAIDGKQPQLIPTGSKELQSLAVSPDGKMIAFAEETADENIWEIDSKTARPLIRSTRADHSQDFSPDGSKIVFASDRTGNYEIWLADADGKNQRQLTTSEKSAGSPRFSPDGKFIAFDAQITDTSDVYVISVNGGAPQKLTEGGKNSFLPAWSADGKTIFFVSNRSGDNQIWKIPANGGEATQITKQGAFEMFAAADGKTIIYSKGSGKAGLWSVGIGGEDEKPISELADVGALRSWFAAERGIYYIEPATAPPFHLKFFDFATRQTKELFKVEKPPLLYYSNLSVSADGKRILYARQDQSASAIMLAELGK